MRRFARAATVLLLGAVLAGCLGSGGDTGTGQTSSVDPISADDFVTRATYDHIYVHPGQEGRQAVRDTELQSGERDHYNRLTEWKGKPMYVANDGGEDVLVHGTEEITRYASIGYLQVIDGKPAYIAFSAADRMALVHGQEETRLTQDRFSGLGMGSDQFLYDVNGEPVLIGEQGFWVDGSLYRTAVRPLAQSSGSGDLTGALSGWTERDFLRVAVTEDGVAYVNGTRTQKTEANAYSGETRTYTEVTEQYVVYPDGSRSDTYKYIGGLLQTDQGITFLAISEDELVLVHDGQETVLGDREDLSRTGDLAMLATVMDGNVAHHRVEDPAIGAYLANDRIGNKNNSFLPFSTGEGIGAFVSEKMKQGSSFDLDVFYDGAIAAKFDKEELPESTAGFPFTGLVDVGGTAAFIVAGYDQDRLYRGEEQVGDIKFARFKHTVGIGDYLAYAGSPTPGQSYDVDREWTVMYNETEIGTYSDVRTMQEIGGNLTYVAVEDGQHKLVQEVPWAGESELGGTTDDSGSTDDTGQTDTAGAGGTVAGTDTQFIANHDYVSQDGRTVTVTPKDFITGSAYMESSTHGVQLFDPVSVSLQIQGLYNGDISGYDREMRQDGAVVFSITNTIDPTDDVIDAFMMLDDGASNNGIRVRLFADDTFRTRLDGNRLVAFGSSDDIDGFHFNKPIEWTKIADGVYTAEYTIEEMTGVLQGEPYIYAGEVGDGRSPLYKIGQSTIGIVAK